MKRQLIVDTNAFLRFLLDDIPVQKVVVEQLFRQALKAEVQLIVPQIVIFELAYTLNSYYKFPKEKVIDMLKKLVFAPFLEVQEVMTFFDAIALYSEVENLSLADCFLVSKARAEGIELFTFDKKLKEARNTN